MSRADPDPSAPRSGPKRAASDDAAASPRRRPSERPEAPTPKLVLSLADGPEALNRAFLRGRRICSRGRG